LLLYPVDPIGAALSTLIPALRSDSSAAHFGLNTDIYF